MSTVPGHKHNPSPVEYILSKLIPKGMRIYELVSDMWPLFSGVLGERILLVLKRGLHYNTTGHVKGFYMTLECLVEHFHIPFVWCYSQFYGFWIMQNILYISQTFTTQGWLEPILMVSHDIISRCLCNKRTG